MSVAGVVHQEEDIGLSTCLHFGNNYWRTFDGLQWQFHGQCKYVMAESASRLWHINIKMVDCRTFSACRKVLVVDSGVVPTTVVLTFNFLRDLNLPSELVLCIKCSL